MRHLTSRDLLKWWVGQAATMLPRSGVGLAPDDSRAIGRVLDGGRRAVAAGPGGVDDRTQANVHLTGRISPNPAPPPAATARRPPEGARLRFDLREASGDRTRHAIALRALVRITASIRILCLEELPPAPRF